jgi:predicted O-methyltransferase YrrM
MSVEPSLRAFATRAVARLLGRSARAYAFARRLGWLPPEERVRWFGARTAGEASRAITSRVGRFLRPSEWVLVIGEDGPLWQSLMRQFQRLGWKYRRVQTPEELDLDDTGTSTLGGVVAADVEADKITAVARFALADPQLGALPLEYATGLEPEQRQFRQHDEYADAFFVSPVLLADPSPYDLYRDSLERFEQKCGLRDYLDLYQLLASVVERGVPGAVAEFGSYKGHSGWLIAKTLEALGSDKRAYLFDTFDGFPAEAGIDYFWSGTHEVRLAEVRAKMSGLAAVELVPGEFDQTLPASGIDRIALAYVDCDSHRAVSYVASSVFEDRLSPGGVMVFEDYGHPALLGCRVAVHDYFDGRADCVRFFSQFSGLYVAVKLGTGEARG